MSLQTGHDRNYDEGFAYSDYFATDESMFSVPRADERLPNKAEILALTFPKHTQDTLAISADFLLDNSVYHDSLADVSLVVLIDPSGANRVYEAGDIRFAAFDGDVTVSDENGGNWTLTEALLEGEKGVTLKRLPAHRAFWFGWHAVHDDTRLVK